MKLNATIIVAFLFFNPHELTKKVLQKFYKILLHQIALFGLANWTKKVFLFSRVTYHTRREQRVPLPIFFGTAILFPEFFSPKGPPFNFFAVSRQNGCWKIPKGPPFQFFFGTVRFFPENKIFSPFNFLMFCDKTPSTATKMLTISEVSPFQRARGSR